MQQKTVSWVRIGIFFTNWTENGENLENVRELDLDLYFIKNMSETYCVNRVKAYQRGFYSTTTFSPDSTAQLQGHKEKLFGTSRSSGMNKSHVP